MSPGSRVHLVLSELTSCGGTDHGGRDPNCQDKCILNVAEFRDRPARAQKVRPPLIDECYGHLECEVVNMVTCGDHTLFVGEIVAASIDDDCLIDGKLNLSAARPITQKNWDYHTLSDL